MNNARPHLALREWRQHFRKALTWTALVGVSAVLALIGPFGTVDSLSLPERAAYWGFLVIVGYAIGYLFGLAVLRSKDVAFARLTRILFAGVLTGIAMTALVTIVNVVVFGGAPAMQEFPVFVGTTVAISVIVMGVIDTFNRNLQPSEMSATAQNTPAPILERLPLDKRGPLVALSVEDHYVRVRTTKGEEMLLLRLADAMREVGSTPGTQVHRSHWAAFDQIARVTRNGDRATLHMKVGGDVPVSRSNLPKLKEAGLLP